MSDDRPISLTNRLELTRREAIKLFAAGIAAFEVGCVKRTGDEIRPAVRRPEDMPGTLQYYATSLVIGGYATGVLVETHEGRPTKIEGNPAHSASLGATTAQHQAQILELYDPHRLRAPSRGTWDRLETELAQLPAGELWVIVPPDGSPAIAAQLARVRARYPQLRVVEHGRRANVYAGTQLAFGAALEPQLALGAADVLVALDADPLCTMPNSVRYSRDFAPRRRLVERGQDPARLFVAEPMLTPTGTLADRRLAIRGSEIAHVALALAAALDRRGVASIAVPADLPRTLRGPADQSGKTIIPWIDAVADALVTHPRRAALVVGDRQPAAVHALVHRLALALGCVGTTTSFTPAVTASDTTLADLADAIRAHRVGAVLAIDCDPVHAAPSLAALLAQVPFTLHASLYVGDTSRACRWVVPLSHPLEAWGDARAYDGTLSPIQPMIQPLHDTRSRLQLLAMLAGDTAPDDHAIVRAQWRQLDDRAWHAALAEGVFATTRAAPVAVAPNGERELVAALAQLPATPGLELDLAPSPVVLDGRFANNAWLQELPHPITKQVWGNAALMSAATAKRLGVGDGSVVRLSRGEAIAVVPALVAPGHADDCITLELGYGHEHADAPIANRLGANGYRFEGPFGGITVVRAGYERLIVRTQHHFDRADREVGFHTELARYRAEPDLFAERRGPLPDLLPVKEHPAGIPQWAMTIDTTICTGCSACVVACQAENNIPVVGAEHVAEGREMHWLRIDTYVEGDAIVNQPMACQHCEHAPCEYVCPVFATTHSPDGLNEMTYNRCVGTRFCSNNCPYKVRRFNWFAYDKPATLASLQHNPDVTVRARGVMEKCTYCVQRIRRAEQAALVDGRPVAPGEVVTACMQVCPTGAIQFAALQHEDTAMVQWRQSGRLYATLHDLGTIPRTMYLAKIRDGGKR